VVEEKKEGREYAVAAVADHSRAMGARSHVVLTMRRLVSNI